MAVRDLVTAAQAGDLSEVVRLLVSMLRVGEGKQFISGCNAYRPKSAPKPTESKPTKGPRRVAAKVDVADRDGYTALICAAIGGHTGVVKSLLSAGAKLNETTKDGFTALARAAYYGHIEVVHQLTTAGANVNKTDNDGNSPLSHAATKGHVAVVEKLIKCRARLNTANSYGNTALMRASAAGHMEAVQLLVNAGSKLDKKNQNGETAYVRAVCGGHAQIVSFLRKHGADTDIPANLTPDDSYHDTVPEIPRIEREDRARFNACQRVEKESRSILRAQQRARLEAAGGGVPDPPIYPTLHKDIMATIRAQKFENGPINPEKCRSPAEELDNRGE